MEMHQRTASSDVIHDALRGVVAEMMGTAAGAGPDGRDAELVQMLNALFGLDLPEHAVVSAPTAAALARSVENAWFESGATAAELAERLAALGEDDL